MKIFYFYPTGVAKKVLAEWDFDYDAFSTAFTAFFNTHFGNHSAATRYHYIAIRFNRRDENSQGYYAYEDEIFLCNITTDKKKFQKELFSTILHEMMHWYQHNVLKWPESQIAPPEEHYYHSPAEKMCRKFEKQTRHVIKLYSALKKIGEADY